MSPARKDSVTRYYLDTIVDECLLPVTDKRGIIMGEFGFVTGDGVYHVTVYATDENGDFRILKMKNYYIGLRKFCVSYYVILLTIYTKSYNLLSLQKFMSRNLFKILQAMKTTFTH